VVVQVVKGTYVLLIRLIELLMFCLLWRFYVVLGDILAASILLLAAAHSSLVDLCLLAHGHALVEVVAHTHWELAHLSIVVGLTSSGQILVAASGTLVAPLLFWRIKLVTVLHISLYVLHRDCVLGLDASRARLRGLLQILLLYLSHKLRLAHILGVVMLLCIIAALASFVPFRYQLLRALGRIRVKLALFGLEAHDVLGLRSSELFVFSTSILIIVIRVLCLKLGVTAKLGQLALSLMPGLEMILVLGCVGLLCTRRVRILDLYLALRMIYRLPLGGRIVIYSTRSNLLNYVLLALGGLVLLQS